MAGARRAEAEGDGADSTRRVALLVADLGWRGVGRTVLNLLQDFDRRGVGCDLVLVRARGDLLDFVPDGVRVVDLEGARVVAALPRLLVYLWRERPRAMISSEDHTNVLALLARRLTGFPERLAVSTHVSPGLWTHRSGLFHKERWLRKAVHWTYPWATARVAVSEGLADEMATEFRLPRESIRVIHNPAVTPELLRDATDPPPHPWLEPDGPPVILGMGSLTPIKGFDVLIRAFARLTSPSDARLVILGGGPERPRLRELVRELGLDERCVLPGPVMKPAPYLARADLFVMASRREALGNALIEAMACGCPVVSTDCPSGPREILEDGAHGPLVPVDDPGALADAMEARIAAPRESNALTRAVDRFRVERVVSLYRDILDL